MLRLYRILTAILAFTGCLSLVISGEVNPFMSLAGIGLFPGYYRFFKGMPQAPRWAVGGCSILTLLVFFFDSLIFSNDYFLGVAHLTITFQAIKSFDLKEPWDHLQVYFMSLLQLIVASELTYSIAFGAIFILFLVVLVSAMVISHFIKEGKTLEVGIKKPVAYISLLTLLITIIFFVSTPRVTGGLWGKGYKKHIRTIGFSERVDFGSFGSVKLDPTVVMRVELSGDVKKPFYWRGITLNYFDGISWKNTLKEKSWIYKEDGRFTIKPFKKEGSTIQRIFLEPMDTDVVFGLSEVAAVESEGRILFQNNTGVLSLPVKKGKRFNYTVYSISEMPVMKENISDYLQLPTGIDEISKIAHSIADRKNGNLEKAMHIEKYLRENYSYSLSTSPPPEGMSPIEDFLFNSKKGYCEHYATAMVLMLRTIGIPARIVTGFYGGELNEYGGYIIVRQSNAHSWLEAVIDGKWRRFDPTPPVVIERPSALVLYVDMIKMKWDRYVIAFSLYDQKEIVKIFSIPRRLPLMPDLRLYGSYGIIYALLPIAGIFTMLFLLRHLRFRKYGFVTAQYIRLRNTIKKKGAMITLSSTPSEVKREAIKLGLDNKVAACIDMYEEYRFGGKKMKEEIKRKYLRLIKGVRNKNIN